MKTKRLAPEIVTDDRYSNPRRWRLVNKDTLAEIKLGDMVETNDGVSVVVTHLQPPHKVSSQGKVCVRYTGSDRSMEYYASVLGAEYQLREDAS